MHRLLSLLAFSLFALVPCNAAIITADALGNAGFSPDFHGVQYVSGAPGVSIDSISYQLPFGFFDFDGIDNFANQTAPILHLPSLVGIVASDIHFAFIGDHPTTLTVNFTSGSFSPGDSFRFAADLDGMGSDLGGVIGAGGGTLISVLLSNGQSGSAHFSTDTSVASLATVNIPDSNVPEPSTFMLIACACCTALFIRRAFPRHASQ